MKEVINRNIMKCQIHAIVKSIVQAKRILKRESITYLDKTDNKNTNFKTYVVFKQKETVGILLGIFCGVIIGSFVHYSM